MRACRLAPLPLALLAFWCAAVSAQDRFPVQCLTFDPAQEGFPSWSPDGATIVYSYVDRRDSGFVAGLHTVPSGGGEPRWLTGEIGEHPNWSRDGTRIAFTGTRANSFDVWVMAVDLELLRAALDPAGAKVQ